MTPSEFAVVASTGGHVDVGKEGNKVWETARKRLQVLFRWKMWEHDNFIHCGVRLEHQKDGGFLLSQNEFVDELREIQIPSRRGKQKESPLSQQEQTELTRLLGGLWWTCEPTGPQHSAATGLQRSRIEQATVQDMIEANRRLQQFKKDSFPTEGLALIGRGDAALENKINGGSTKGPLLSWRSGLMDRVCRSATCAETRAMVGLEDELFAVRY